MALSTYTDLQSAVASWLKRTDLTDAIPDFITLAESRLNRALRLRVMEKEVALSIAAGARSVALPASFVEPLGLWASDASERRELRYLSPDQIEVLTSSGDLYFWTITGPNIEFERPASSAVSLVLRYVEGFALSDAAPINWLLTNHPDAYLFAALVESSMVTRDEGLTAMAEARFSRALAEIEQKEGRSRSMVTLTADVPALPSRYRYHLS